MSSWPTTNRGYVSQGTSSLTALQRPRRLTALALLGVILSSVALGLATALGVGAILAALVLVTIVAIIGVRHRWGTAICLAPVFLLPVTTMPTLPNVGPIHPRLILAIVSAGLATLYWRSGAGRPKLNYWSLAAVGFLGIALLALGLSTGLNSLQEAVSLTMFAYTGVIIGQCLQDPIALKAVAYLAVPIAVLALLEAGGLKNLWAIYLHADKFEGSAQLAIRSTASFGHPLIAGACLVVTGLLLLSVRRRSATVSGIICIAAAATTVSRSTLLGGALGIALFAAQAQGHRIRIVFITVALALVALVIINSVPELKHSVDSRVLDINQGQIAEQESVRSNSLTIFKEEFDVDPGRLLIGGGAGSSSKLLTARGGNLDGYDIFDNEYITMTYDAGFLVVLCVFGLLTVAAMKSGKLARRQALPALAAIIVIMYFVDGVEWPSLGVVAWMTIGFFSAPALSDSGTSRRRALMAST
jgi:hypothetical protein